MRNAINLMQPLKNFEKISFNIGPTLFNWMQSYDPITYEAIITQERRTFETNGVGNGLLSLITM
jgi:hypothetical protein